MSKSRDKVLGALLGVAVGDALGAPLEFMSAEEIQRKYGGNVREMVGGGWLNVKPGEVTDDTQMTLAVAEGIVENPGDPVPAIGRRFIEWYDSNPKDIGNCCRAAIEYAKADGANSKAAWHRAAERVDSETGGQTAGNGALMRTVYPGLFYNPDSEEWMCEQFAVSDIARMTHCNAESTMTCFLYSWAISYTVDVYAIDIRHIKHNIERIMSNVFITNGFKIVKPSGYVIDSAICAVNAVFDTETFEDAIIQAVNLGGDADTIGAITGGLAGAVYGATAIPQRWVRALDKRVVRQIERLADKAMK